MATTHGQDAAHAKAVRKRANSLTLAPSSPTLSRERLGLLLGFVGMAIFGGTLLRPCSPPSRSARARAAVRLLSRRADSRLSLRPRALPRAPCRRRHRRPARTSSLRENRTGAN